MSRESDFLEVGVDSKAQAQITNIELQKLETRVDDLLQTCSKLVNENKSLRRQQETLVTERANLVEKNRLARTRIEAMITRLKSLETHS